VWQNRIRRALKGDLSQPELHEAARLTEEWKHEYVDSDRRMLAMEVCHQVSQHGKNRINVILPSVPLTEGMLKQAKHAMEEAYRKSGVSERYFVSREDLPQSLASAYITARCREEELEVALHCGTKRPVNYIKMEIEVASPTDDEGVLSDESAPSNGGREESSSAHEP
jgi:hypothetical protein